VLGTLLAALLLGAATFDRSGGSGWPTVIGDEATYLMQAESLAFDLDLTYSRQDFDRFVRHWGVEPEGLILQKGEHADEMVYGKPFYYALWAAPFVRLSPTRGPFVANALLLALAAVATAVALRRTVGGTAPSWTAVLVFGSVAFAHVFWAHLDLFLMCLTALGLALIAGREEPGEPPSPSARPGLWVGRPGLWVVRDGLWVVRDGLWAVAGLLLATVAYARPLYASLFLPAALAAWRLRRWRAVGALAAGALALTLGTLAVQQSLVGSWTSYGAERRSFNGATGFPEVDLPSAEWDAMIERWGNASWLQRRGFGALTGRSPGTPRLWGWNTLYFLAGETIGFLPYLLPGLLGFVSWGFGRRGSGGREEARPDPVPGPFRWALVGAVILTAAGFFVLRPFNFYGGGGALANRYILPVYPALWFLPTRPVRPAWLAGAILVAAPFLWPLWTAPRAYPLDAGGLFHHVSPVARALLPYETTQSHMRPTGARFNVRHRGLWIKSLTPAAIWTDNGGGTFELDPGAGPAVLLVGDDRPLEALHLELETAGLPVTIGGGRITGRTALDGGRTRLWIELDGPRARHPMWWTGDQDFVLYDLRIDAGARPGTDAPHEPIELTLAPAAR
jgi:hypothetical protein